MKLIEQVRLPSKFNFSFCKASAKNDWRHAHQGMEFLYVHSGTGTISIEDRTREVAGPCLVYIQPFQLHRVRMDDDEPYIRTVLTIDPLEMAECAAPYPRLNRKFHALWKEKLPDQLFLLPPDNPFPQAFKQLHHELEKLEWPDRWEQIAIFSLRFLPDVHALVFQSPDSRPAVKGREPQQAERILLWLDANFDSPFSLGLMARELHVSPSYISHMLPRYTGQTLREYVASKRLKKACFLLASSMVGTRDIALQCGFSSDSYFCQVFKRNIGWSPGQYRQQHNPAFRLAAAGSPPLPDEPANPQRPPASC